MTAGGGYSLTEWPLGWFSWLYLFDRAHVELSNVRCVYGFYISVNRMRGDASSRILAVTRSNG